MKMTIRHHKCPSTNTVIKALSGRNLPRLIFCGVLLAGCSATGAFGQSGEAEFQRKMEELKQLGKQSQQPGAERSQGNAPSATEIGSVPGGVRHRNIDSTPGTCRQQHDRFRDTTNFDLVVGTIHKTKDGPLQQASRAGEHNARTEELRLALTATTSGKQPDGTSPPQVDFYFQSVAPSYRYHDEVEVLMIIDGERVKIGTAHSLGGLAIMGDVEERLGMRVPAKLFLRIANAREVEVRIGSNEFQLEDAALKAMRDFASCAGIK